MKEYMSSVIIFMFVSIFTVIVLQLTIKSGEVIGVNINNEIKEYRYINNDNYGVTADGTRELLKSYKYKK